MLADARNRHARLQARAVERDRQQRHEGIGAVFQCLAAEPAGLFGGVDTGVDTEQLALRLLDDGYLLAPGALFHAERRPSTLMRINFATTQEAYEEAYRALFAALDEIEARLGAIEEQSKRTQVSLDATIAQLDGGLTEVRQAIAAVPAAAAPVDLAPLETQLKGLEDRVTAIGAGASSADAAALAQTISSIEAGIAELRTQLTALDQRVAATDSAISGLKGDVSATQTAISTQNQTLGGAEIGPAVRLPLMVSGLETAIANGRPFAAELAGLKALLPDLAVPGPVEAAAAEGLPRPDAVVAQFTAAVPNLLAGRAAVSTGDMGEDALEWMKGLLALRPVGEVAGDTPEAIVSRLEAAVGRHDFKAAAELLAQLPPAMQAGAGTAGADITKLAVAEEFATTLRSRALAPTAEATP